MAFQRLMFYFRRHEIPRVLDTGKHEPKRWVYQLLVVPRLFCFDLCVDFAAQNQPFFVKGLSQKVTTVEFSVHHVRRSGREASAYGLFCLNKQMCEPVDNRSIRMNDCKKQHIYEGHRASPPT